MSCRVAKKFCEQSVLLSLAERMKATGVVEFKATLLCTGRNGALVEAFDVIPFEKNVEEIEGGEIIHYVMKLDDEEDRLSAKLYRNKVEWLI